MTFVVADRVQETCAAPGTGSVTLLGASTGYQSFSNGIGANNQTFYTIVDQSGGNWEVGIGTVGATGLTLARTTVLSSSNSGSLVNFLSGIQNVWGDYPAGRAVYGNGTVLVAPSGALLQPSNGGTGQSNLPAAMAALQGFTTTATAAGTTTLTSASTFNQVFTGSTTQTIVLPVTSTLSQGWTYQVFNNSTGNLLVQSSGGNSILTVLPNTSAEFVCILTSGTTAASWSAFVDGFSSTTGTGSAVLATSPALLGSPTTPTPTLADSSTKIASTAFVQQALGNYQNSTQTSSATTLTASQAGQLIVVGGGTTGITLPALSSVPVGATFNFIGQVAAPITAAGSDKLYTSWGGMVSSVTLGSSQTLQITNASGVWYITQGNILSELPSWTTSTRPASPVAGQNGFNTTTGFAEYWNGSQWAYYGTLSATSVNYLVVAGGGGGGSQTASVTNGGGGGAGGVSASSVSVTPGTSYTITVGAGGAVDSNGSNSSLGSLIVCIGGGKGGGIGANVAGGNGGSGGGGSAAGGGGAGGSGTSGQGQSGGQGSNGGNYIGGGGGGANQAGASGSSTGNGGNGYTYPLTGYSVGGGGGGGGNSGNFGTGGGGGGGNGGTNITNSAVAGTVNTGGGGGGSANNTNSAAPGGSGIIIISYPITYKTAVATGTYSYTTSSGNQIYTFTGSGTITF